jgi:hypothetical protein
MRPRDGRRPLGRDRTKLPSAERDPTESARLAALLDAAAAPPRMAERAGEDAAVAAYRAARMAQSRAPVPATALPWARAGVWIAAVAVAGTAGAALAAGVPTLGHSPRSTESGGHVPSTPQAPAATPHLASSPTRSPSPTGSGSQAPAAALNGFCTAYLANGGQPGKALSSAALRDLVEAAGGPGRVMAYCQDLVLSEKPKPPRSSPGDGGRPSAAPTHRPSVPA